MNEFRWSGRKAVIVAVLGALVSLSGCASQGPVAVEGLEQKIESASSRADHEEIATQYERQSVLDAAAAKRHTGYAASYRKNTSQRSGVQQHLALARHCENLAQAYQKAADENSAMAKAHRELGAAAK